MDGKIVVGGSSGLVRYMSDGAQGDNFGMNGIVVYNNIGIYSLAISY